MPEGQSDSRAGAELAQGPVGLRGHMGPPGQGHCCTQPGAAMSHAVVRGRPWGRGWGCGPRGFWAEHTCAVLVCLVLRFQPR